VLSGYPTNFITPDIPFVETHVISTNAMTRNQAAIRRRTTPHPIQFMAALCTAMTLLQDPGGPWKLRKKKKQAIVTLQPLYRN